MLLKKVKDYAIETGAKNISLSTALDNHKAQKLYKKNGYIRDSQFYQYELSLDYSQTYLLFHNRAVLQNIYLL